MVEILLGKVAVLILGLVFLVTGADFFVKAAASIAKKFGVSEFVIGLTLVAVGTSIPELASSVAASIQQQSDLVIGNVIGSNIANIGLIIGLAATAAVIKTREEMLKRDGYIMLFAAIVLYGFIISGMISRVEAVIFLLLYSAYVFFLFRAKPKFTDESGFKGFITYFFKFEYVREVINAVSDLNKRKEKRATRTIQLQATKAALLKEGVILILSCIAVIFGAHYLIVEAVFFAEFFHISKTFIGISLVAVGTSLPELSVTLSASRQGYGDIAVANVIGSNIANIFLVLGISALVFPVAIKKITILAIAPFMIFMTVLLLIFIKSDWELRRIEGIIFLILYSIFIIFFFSTSVIQ